MAKLEVIAFLNEDIEEINKSKAHRIELVEQLDKGGLTPSLELIKYAQKNSKVPIRVMIRPHDNGFIYDTKTVNLMLEQIENVKKIGCEGVVFGALNAENKLDFEITKKLVEASKPMKITFHRAIDDIPTHFLSETISQLEKLKIDTILTSLGYIEDDKTKRFNILKNTNIEVMYGSGLNLNNMKNIKELYPFTYYHMGTAIRENGKLSGKILVSIIDEVANFFQYDL